MAILQNENHAIFSAAKQRVKSVDQSKPTASPPILNADIYWVHLLKDMIHSGEAAKIGPYALAVYVVIKAHVNMAGSSFPSVQTIAEKSGMSDRQVLRQLKILTEAGFLKNAREGKGSRNLYILREKVHIQGGGEGAVASWDYVPSKMSETLAELKNILLTGNPGSTNIHIENLHINLTMGDTIINTGAPIEHRIKDLREAIKPKK